MTDPFVHLHVHTEYSMLDGAAKIKPALERALELNQPALAQTDHGNMFGAYEFFTQANEVGIKPILGMEGYLAPVSRFDRKKEPIAGIADLKPTDYTHITLLAQDNEGLKNLFKLSSLAYVEGWYSKPRLDAELLSQYSKGIIGTTGCMGGEVKQLLLADQFDAAVNQAAMMRDIFGKDNYFVEIMDHGLDEENKLFQDLLRLSKKLGIPLLATNDSHYVSKDQAHSHDALLCVQTGAQINKEKRFRFDGSGYYIQSSEEMRDLWKDYPEACDNTLAIADRCNVSIVPRDDLFPRFPVPEGETEQSWLYKETWKGANQKYSQITPEIEQRIKYELDIIAEKGYCGYFLVVSDIIRAARRLGIRIGPARGSAGGSIVAYLTDIIQLDPLKHHLMFERFLNPERFSPPDIDIDIQDDRRDELVAYVKDRYGKDKVAQVVTFNTFKAKAAMKDASRVLGFPPAFGDMLSKQYPKAMQGKEAPLDVVTNPKNPRYQEATDLRKTYNSDERAKKVIDLAKGFEGLKRGTGVHAAALIMSAEPLIDLIPMMQRDKDKAYITQFDYPTCEHLGLLKMDFLGLRNLSILEHALDNIEARIGNRIVLEDLALDDKKTYQLMARGDTLGVFQLDGEAMRTLLRRMRPSEFEHISAVLALYRPGPMGVNAHNKYADRKNGREKVDYIDPELEEALKPILSETYGLCVYQEQIMKIAQVLAGYSLSEADILRKIMGKKKKEDLDKIEPEFKNRMLANGYSEHAFHAIWDTIVPFSDYAFNRAHTAGYGLLSYWTAYLKANYPADYMAAVLSSVDDIKAAIPYLAECKRMGIVVQPPNINLSRMDYSATPDGEIVFGLGGIKGIGEGPVKAIQAAREKGGNFISLTDLIFRTGLMKKNIEPLILSGALDCFGYTRAGLWENFEPVLNKARVWHREQQEGVQDLWSVKSQLENSTFVDLKDPSFDVPEWGNLDKLEKEYTTTGMYLSGHPLDGYMESIERSSTVDWTELSQYADQKVVIGGLITNVRHATSKKGNPWVDLNLLGEQGVIRAICFDSKCLEENASLFQNGRIVLVRGVVSVEDSDVDEESDSAEVHENNSNVTFKITDIKQVQKTDKELEILEPLVLNLSKSQLTSSNNNALNHIIRNNRGPHEVVVKVSELNRAAKLPHKIAFNEDAKRKILALFGNTCIESGMGE